MKLRKPKIITIIILAAVIFTSTILVLAQIGRSGPDAAPNLAEHGLVGYWNMEEGKGQTVYDRSGNANNGTLGASTSVAKDDPVFTGGYSSAGAGGTGLKFDGVDDYVQLSSNNYGTTYTLSFWGKTNSTTGTHTFIGSYYSYVIISSTLLSHRFNSGGGTLVSYSHGVTITDWHNYAVTRSGTGTVNFYVDGIYKGQAVATNSAFNTGYGNYTFGRWRNGLSPETYTNYFNGLIDEVRIYNRALSADEIRQHYNQKKPILEMKFDEGSGTSTKDESFNNNDLTLVNTPAWLQGKFGSALNFTKTSSQYGYLADNASISLTKDLTISAWVKPASITAATLFDIAGKWDGANESYLLAQYGDEIRLYIDAAANYKTTDAANLQIGQWYHIEGVYNATARTVNIYVNGVLQTGTVTGTVTGTIPASIGDDTGRLHIGAEDSSTAAANFYDGAIDSVRIYNYARTPAEILTDYNNGLAAHLR